MDIWFAFILGVVEGLTEFLPISSTGHQIIVADLLGFTGPRAQAFNIIIQLAAVLAVVWEYRRTLLGIARGLPNDPLARRFVTNLVLAFLPAAVTGALFAHAIHNHLFNPVTVALALVVGGLIMLAIERQPRPVQCVDMRQITPRQALQIGCAQCLALIPGTSRSAATIIGGMLFGLSRKVATEFSFFLAVPTMLGASVLSGYHYRELFQWSDLPVFAVGFVTAFIFAVIAIRGLLRFVSGHSYAPFAWYRIVFGLAILLTWHFGLIHWSAQ